MIWIIYALALVGLPTVLFAGWVFLDDLPRSIWCVITFRHKWDYYDSTELELASSKHNAFVSMDRCERCYRLRFRYFANTDKKS